MWRSLLLDLPASALPGASLPAGTTLYRVQASDRDPRIPVSGISTRFGYRGTLYLATTPYAAIYSTIQSMRRPPEASHWRLAASYLTVLAVRRTLLVADLSDVRWAKLGVEPRIWAPGSPIGDSNELAEILVRRGFAGLLWPSPIDPHARRVVLFGSFWQLTSSLDVGSTEDRPTVAEAIGSQVGPDAVDRFMSPTASPAPSRVGTPRHPRLETVLLVADEWLPSRGGITTFNRDLAKALVRSGVRVYCLVPSHTHEEALEADGAGVVLINPTGPLPQYPVLAFPAALPSGVAPDVIVGHDRITGSQAINQRFWFRSARVALVVHSVPRDYEWLEPDGEAVDPDKREAELRAYASVSDVVFAVGPRLQRMASPIIDTPSGTKPVVRLDPGLLFSDSSAPARIVPSSVVCLFVGRATKVALKGVDIALQAFAALPHELKDSCKPELWVRGCPAGQWRKLKKDWAIKYGIPESRIQVKEFSNDPSDIARELSVASVLLAPSRAEGFGLSALEAIAAGTPLLLSNESGLAEILKEQLAMEDLAVIVPVQNSKDDAAVWSIALERILRDRQKAFEDASRLRTRMSTILTWDQTVATFRKQFESVG